MFAIAVDPDETATGTALVFGPYDDEAVAEADWKAMGRPYHGVVPLRTPPATAAGGSLEAEDVNGSATLRFSVLVRQSDDGGFWSEVVGVPGAGSQANTLDETIKATRESLHAVLTSMRQQGDLLPALRESDRWVTLKFRDL
ncbi:MAG: type II toxin-antitoxin system HicB family antitoxin [Chloroflexi bacterium]|nr:type II toxin-antitoxin system HicB family antitoxin [Chloroflexota bacterium]